MKDNIKRDLKILDEILGSGISISPSIVSNVSDVKKYIKQLAFRKSFNKYHEDMFVKLLSHIDELLAELEQKKNSEDLSHAERHYYDSYIGSIERIKESVTEARSDLGSFIYEVDREHIKSKCVRVLAEEPTFIELGDAFINSYECNKYGVIAMDVNNDSLSKFISLISLDDQSFESLTEVFKIYSILRKRSNKASKTVNDLEFFEFVLKNEDMIKNYLAYRSVANKQVPYISDLCRQQTALMDEYEKYESDTSIFKLFTGSMREQILLDADLLYFSAVVQQTILDDIRERIASIESTVSNIGVFERVCEFADGKCDLALYSTDAVISKANFVQDRTEASKVIDAARTRVNTLTSKLDRINAGIKEQKLEYDKASDSLSKDLKDFIGNDIEFYTTCHDLLVSQHDISFSVVISLILLHVIKNVNSLTYSELSDVISIDVNQEEYDKIVSNVVQGVNKFYNDKLNEIENVQKMFDKKQFISK